jgi:hypothetical protein
MSFTTVFERLNNPRNYYSTNYANQWRGLVGISYERRDDIFRNQYEVTATTFKRLKQIIKKLPESIHKIHIAHFETVRGNLFRLPIIKQIKYPYYPFSVTFSRFPVLGDLPIPVETPQIQRIPEELEDYYEDVPWPLEEVYSLTINQCEWINYQSLPNHKATTLRINGYSDLSYIPQLPIQKYQQSFENFFIKDCYIVSITLEDNLPLIDPSTLDNIISLCNIISPEYDFSKVGRIYSDGGIGITYRLLTQHVLEFNSKKIFPSLRDLSFVARIRDTVATDRIMFTCTLASNPLRRAFEYI